MLSDSSREFALCGGLNFDYFSGDEKSSLTRNCYLAYKLFNLGLRMYNQCHCSYVITNFTSVTKINTNGDVVYRT